MEHIVDSRRCIKPKTVTPYSLYYCVLGILRVELLGWSVRPYVLEVKPYLIPNLELRGLVSLPVHHFLLKLLGRRYHGLRVLSCIAELTYNIIHYLDK
jgi:hypothetical protein